MPQHIFISYKSQERSDAIFVKERLEEWGYDVWLDVDALVDPNAWMTEINDAILSSALVIALVSPLSISSRYVTNEWDIALVNQIPVLLIKLQEVDVVRKFSTLPNVHLDDFYSPSPRTTIDTIMSGSHQSATVDKKHVDNYDYLVNLYNTLSKHIASRSITTLKTYDIGDIRIAEPLPLRAETNTEKYDNVIDALHEFRGSIVLLGKPGSGKSVTLYKLALDIIVKYLFDGSGTLPIVRDLTSWDIYEQPELIDWICRSDGIPHDARALIADGKATIILDGLDELSSSIVLETKQQHPDKIFLEKLENLSKMCPTVTSCRTNEYIVRGISSAFSFDLEITLLPYNREQLAHYLRDQKELHDFVTSDRNIENWLNTPLLISLFAFAYESMDEDTREKLRELKTELDLRDELIRNYVVKRYMHEKKKKAFPELELTHINQFLSELALRDSASKNNKSYSSQLTMGDDSFSDFSIPPPDRYSDIGQIPTRLFESSELEQSINSSTTYRQMFGVAEKLDLLSNVTNNTYQFLHLTIRDYFAVQALRSNLAEYDLSETSLKSFGYILDERLVSNLLETLRTNATKDGMNNRKFIILLADFKNPHSFLYEALKSTSASLSSASTYQNWGWSLQLFSRYFTFLVANSLLNDSGKALLRDWVRDYQSVPDVVAHNGAAMSTGYHLSVVLQELADQLDMNITIDH